MKKTIHILLTIAVALILLQCGVGQAEVAPPAARVELRGFGELKIDRHADDPAAGGSGAWITFTASDAHHATLCASKFLADYTAVGPVRVVSDSGLPGTVM